jgi:hypothetical protein
MLVGDGKDEKMLNGIMAEWHEFKIKGQMLPLLDMLNKVVPMSGRFPLLSSSVKLQYCRHKQPHKFGLH